ncbi:MAG: CRISPR-associated protein Cas4 [Halioglobus sp.]|nr:CRISPR-associated protein Cas4 [Halioglobus sp.]
MYSDGSLPVSTLRQLIFCSRIPYISESLGIAAGSRPWLRQGVDYQQRQEMLNKRRTLGRYHLALDGAQIIHNYQLRSKKLRIHGICDAVIKAPHFAAPVEFKMSEDKPGRGQIVQLVAYGLILAEELHLNVTNGYILYGERGRTLEVSMKLWKPKVLELITDLHDLLAYPLLPSSSASEAQCGQCEYLNFCADRF